MLGPLLQVMGAGPRAMQRYRVEQPESIQDSSTNSGRTLPLGVSVSVGFGALSARCRITPVLLNT